jgi:hypothetical protein
MEKDNPQPKTQPSGNKPPPRPPTRVAVGMLPGDEDPEKSRQRKMHREIVLINLPTGAPGKPPVQPPLSPAAASAILRKKQTTRIEFHIQKENWPAFILLILAIWAFIGAVVTMMLTLNFVSGGSSLANLGTFFVLVLLWVIPAHFIQFPTSRAGNPKPHYSQT